MNHANTRGFTIVELMLAMSFVSLLLIAIAITTIQISNIYTRGLTLREVDQAGRNISDELQRSIASSVPFDVTPKVDASPATATSKYVVRPGGGRLCLGRYTYAWNFGEALKGAAGAPAIYNKYDDGSEVRFAKVADSGGALCADPTLTIKKADSRDLLTSGDRDLVIHAFNIIRTLKDDENNQSLYDVTMIIGTNDQDQLTIDDASCKPPAAGVGDEAYCAVNQFELVARAGNTSGGGE